MHEGSDGSSKFIFDLMESERPKVDRAVLDFVKGHVFDPADFVIRTDGVCRPDSDRWPNGRNRGSGRTRVTGEYADPLEAEVQPLLSAAPDASSTSLATSPWQPLGSIDLPQHSFRSPIGRRSRCQ
jgi:hypothetical protein